MKKLLIFICLILFLIPFFWLKPGEMDLGGDGSRLYFYDPVSYLKSHTFFGISSSGLGSENIGFYGLPFIICLSFLKSILRSPTVLISFFNGLSLTGAFLFCYFTIKELSKEVSFKENLAELGAILGGLFYIFSPAPINGWDKAILTHNQIFLNPLIFYLLLKFFTSRNLNYLLTSLIVTFIFSPNFSFAGAPSFFAFYPFSLLFILIYTKYIKKTSIPVKGCLLGLILFLAIQSFHLIPQLISMTSSGSLGYNAVFSSDYKFSRGLNYFLGIAPQIKVVVNLLSLEQLAKISASSLFFIIFPLIVVVSFLLNKKNKTILLVAIFFLISLYWTSANITNLGLEFYKALFKIPGFSMFRNFYGQWGYLYLFFYSLLIGLSFPIIINKIEKRYAYGLTIVLSSFLFILAWPFINGSLINKTLWQTKDVKSVTKMDPEYERLLNYVKGLKDDGKILTLPITDPGYQLLAGEKGGVYIGPSTISYLTGKKDFAGYEDFGPFKDIFLSKVRENDFDSIGRILSVLNIKYIFYNSDPYIYDKNFQGVPYTIMKKNMPFNQKMYEKFIDQLDVEKRFDFGDKYHILKLSKKNYLPHIYASADAINMDKEDINQITLPFIFGEDARLNIHLLDKKDNKDMDYITAKRINNNIETVKKDKNTLRLSSSVSIDLYDTLYPLLALERTMQSFPYKGETQFFDSGVYSLRTQIKRMSQGNLTRNDLFNYELNLKNLIETTAKKKDTFYSTLGNRLDLFFILQEHEKYLYKLLEENLNYSEAEKNNLKNLTARIFEDSFNSLNLNNSDFQLNYKMSFSRKGDYEIYLKNDYTRNKDENKLKLLINNMQISSPGNSRNGLTGFGDFYDLKGEDINISLTIPNYPFAIQKNLFNSNQGKNFILNDGVLFEFIRSLIQEAVPFYSNQAYFITFDYFLKNGEWNTFNAFAEVADDGREVWLKIIDSQEGLLNKLQSSQTPRINFKNVSIIKFYYPTIIFKKSTSKKEKEDFPQISFIKINPTKYKIKVENAKNPYALLFSDAFNRSWKLYLSDNNSPKEKITESYFGGDVKEGVHKQIFFDQNTFETWGKKSLADRAHFQANGYANGWHIIPSDVWGRKDYELILEMTNQRVFYFGLAISIAVFLGCLMWAVKLFIKSYITAIISAIKRKS